MRQVWFCLRSESAVDENKDLDQKKTVQKGHKIERKEETKSYFNIVKSKKSVKWNGWRARDDSLDRKKNHKH